MSFFLEPVPDSEDPKEAWPPGGRTFLFKSHAPDLTRWSPPGVLTQLQFVFAASLDEGAVVSVQAEASWQTVPR